MTVAVDKRRIMEILNRVYDPDYTGRSVVDMGLVTEDDITIKDNEVGVAYGLTAPMCPFSAAGKAGALGLRHSGFLPKPERLPAFRPHLRHWPLRVVTSHQGAES